jgi:hypothetical protein
MKKTVSLSVRVDDLLDISGDISLPKNDTFTLIIDYPLDEEAKFKINTGKGLSGLGLMKIIGKKYDEVYRNADKYGIWGHEMSDLVLCGIDVDYDKKTIRLGVDS